MDKDNPACYECPKAEKRQHGMHYWIDLRGPPRGAICLNCGLQLNEEHARQVGFRFQVTAPPTQEEIDRFYSHVDILPNGCHFWNGARSRGKNRSTKWYGSFHYRGKVIRAHRFAHDILGGKVCPPGYHRDHVCVFSLCVNEDHIEVITREENERRKREREAVVAKIKITVSVSNVVKKVTEHAVGYYSGRCRACNAEGFIEGHGLPGYMICIAEPGVLVHKRYCDMNAHLLSDGQLKEQSR